MEKPVEDLFNSFFLKLVKINYKQKEGIKISDEDTKIINILKILIPIFNRIEKDGNIDLDDITENNKSVSSTKTELDGYYKSSESTDSEDEPDPVGDQQIKELTLYSLGKLNQIRTNGWVIVEPDNEDQNTMCVIEN